MAAWEWAADPSPTPRVLQKLEEQEQQAQRLKEKLRSKQQSLQQQLEQLQGPPGARERDRLRADSLDSSGLSSERSDSDQGGEYALERVRLGRGEWTAEPVFSLQRIWKWMWKAWCLGRRRSSYRASALGRSTATHTAPAPGYDDRCLSQPVLSGLSLPCQWPHTSRLRATC